MTSSRRKRSRRTPQLGFDLRVRTWGGARENAGRKKSGKKGLVPHRTRPVHKARHPVQITLRVVDDVPTLRTNRLFSPVREALIAGSKREGFRLIEFSVQTNHLHLIVEASDNDALSKGMQGVSIRIARAINKALGRKGKVFAGRYHARELKTPREVRCSLAYVLLNSRRHAAQHGPFRREAGSTLALPAPGSQAGHRRFEGRWTHRFPELEHTCSRSSGGVTG